MHAESHHQCSGAVTREKLIEAAGVIFGEKGFYGARIRDITERAGANIAAVNYYFHDKMELYSVVLRQAHGRTAAAIAAPLTADTPEGRIRQLLEALLSAALDPTRPEWHRQVMGRELAQPTPAIDRLHADLQRPTHRLRDAIRELRPELSEEDASLAACDIIAQVLFYVHHRHILRRLFPAVGEPTAERLATHVVEFSLSGLRDMRPGDAVQTPANAEKRRRKTRRKTD